MRSVAQQENSLVRLSRMPYPGQFSCVNAGLLRLALALMVVLSIILPASGRAGSATPIFVLHSYSQEYPWTKRQHEAFMQSLVATLPGAVDASVEYLDGKRVPYTAAYGTYFAGYLARKYARFAPKLIYVTDDNALVFAIAHLNRVFPKVPIIFSGINDYGMKQRIDPNYVTGVFENKEIAPNLELMRRIAPGVQDILVVGDESETFQAIKHDVIADIARQPDVRAHFISDGRIEQLIADLKVRSEKFVFLTTLGAITDATGRTLTLPEVVAAIVNAGRFIVISMEDVYLFPGVLGGYVTSGHKQGAAAAEMSARYLSGTAIAAIKPIEKSPNEYIFDGAELAKLGIKLPADLSSGATILNPLPTIYERYLPLIVRSLYVFALLLGLSLATFSFILIRKNRQIARHAIAITAQSRRISESEEKLRGLYELSPLGIALNDSNGRFFEFNEAFQRICGYSADELRSMDYWTLTPRKYGADEAQQLEILERSGLYGPYEKEYIHKDGHLVPVRLNGMLITGKDGKKYIWSIIEDITNIREASLAIARDRIRLETILRTASDGIHILNDEGLLVEANDSFLKLIGYGRDAIGHLRVEDWHSGSDRNVLLDSIKTLIDLRESIVFEAKHRRQDGTILDVEISACGIEIDGQRFVYASSRDISERKKAAAELAKLNAELELRVTQRTAELEAANKELDSFSYTIAHDMRAPVRAINAFSQMALESAEGTLDQKTVGNLKRVVAGGRHMANLIDDLLNLARLSRQEMRVQNCDMSQLAATACAALATAHPERKVIIKIQAGMTFSGDPGLMRATLDNLIGNAWKYTAKTSAARIEVGNEWRDGNTVYYVRDNGAGFDMRYVHKLFAPFQRLHHRDEFEGTGIGLATVKKIIERHGGKIWIESAVNVGTTVFFTVGESV